MNDPIEDQRIELFYKMSKKRTFEEYVKEYKKQRRITFIMVFILTLSIFANMFLAVGVIYLNIDEKADDKSFINLGKEICEKANQSFVTMKIYQDGKSIITCNKEIFIIGGV